MTRLFAGGQSTTRAILATVMGCAAFLVLPSGAGAQVHLPVMKIGERGVRIDGSLREFRGASFIDIGQGPDASASFLLGYDDEALYVVARVHDDRMVRTRSPSQREDALVVTIAEPYRRGRGRGRGQAHGRGHGMVAKELFLYAGVTGRSSSMAALGGLGQRPRLLRDAEVVEGPLRSGKPGYVLEARIPFRALGVDNLEDARGSVRLIDVDDEARPRIENEPSYAPVLRRELDRLPQFRLEGGARSVVARFLEQRGAESSAPLADFTVDVQGDGRPERVVVVDRYVLRMSTDGDGEFVFFELPVQGAADVMRPSLKDVDGDRRPELTVTLRQGNRAGSREMFFVVGLGDAQLSKRFAVETLKRTRDGLIENRLDVLAARRGKAPVLRLSLLRDEGLSPDNFREATARDAEPILLPWGPIKARRYQWSGQAFAQVGEEANPAYAPPEPNRVQARPAGSPTPEQDTGAAPSTAALIDGFKNAAGLSRGQRPDQQLSGDVAGSAAKETVVRFGANVAVMGPEFRSGTGWFHTRLPVAGDGDVGRMQLADVTGDGRRELLVPITQHFGQVDRDVLLVYQFQGETASRLFAVEVARRQGRAHVTSRYAVSGQGRSVKLVITAGSAQGFSKVNWPFDMNAPDGVEPLLLPWEARERLYVYRNGALVRR